MDGADEKAVYGKAAAKKAVAVLNQRCRQWPMSFRDDYRRVFINVCRHDEWFRQPVLNRQIACTYLAATGSEAATRTWQVPMDEMTKTKTGSTRMRQGRAMKDKAFDLICTCPFSKPIPRIF